MTASTVGDSPTHHSGHVIGELNVALPHVSCYANFRESEKRLGTDMLKQIEIDKYNLCG